MKKGISLIILVITILVIFVFSTIVIKNGIDMRVDINYIKLEKEIEVIEKAIKKAKLKDKTYGTGINIKIRNETNGEKANAYRKIKNYLINNHNISTYCEDYMILEKEDLQKMNIDNIEGPYVVNYEREYIFSVNPVMLNDEKIYTTQDIGIVDESNSYKYYVEYNSSTGKYPETDGKFTFIGGAYYPSNSWNNRALENGLLKTWTPHLYSIQTYNIAGHSTAQRCEITVDIESWAIPERTSWPEYSAVPVSITLTNGEKCIAAGFEDTWIGYGIKIYESPIIGVNDWQNKYKSYEIPESFVFRVYMNEDYAQIYIDDELIYTVPYSEMASKTGVSSCVKLNPMTETYIKKITYKEW